VKTFIRNLFGELAIIGIIPLLFMISLLLFQWDKITLNDNNLTVFTGVLLATAVIEIIAVLVHFLGFSRERFEEFVYENKEILLVLLIVIASRLPFLNTLPRWDSAEYYYRLTKGLENCDFSSFASFQKNFALCGHPTLAFSAIYLIGEMMWPGHVIMVHSISLILTVIAFWCIYKILKKVLKKASNKEAAIYTFVVSFAPLVYSSFSYFTPDYAMAIFVIYVLCACVYNRPLLAGFFSMICFQTKETGIVLIGGFSLGILIHYVKKFSMERFADKSIVLEMLKDARLYFILAAAVIQLLYNKFIGGVSQWTQNQNETPGLRWDNHGMNCLGLNPEYILVKLKQQFVLNFNWLVVLLIFAGYLYFRLHNHRKMRLNLKYVEIIAAFWSYVAFSCIYITASLARYNVVGDILLYLILFGVLHRAFEGRSSIVVSVGVAALLLTESFLTIDPVSLQTFLRLNLGNTDILYVGDTSNALYYGDYMVYNTQYLMVNRALDKILREVDYSPETMDVLVSDANGACITGNSAVFMYQWDEKNQKRVFYKNGNTTQMPEAIEVRRLFQEHLQDQAVLIYLPYNTDVSKEDMLELAGKYYDVGEEQTFWTLQGCVYYYTLTLAD